MLSPFIHIIVIFLILTRSNVIHPLLVVEVPAHGLFDALLELERGLPTKLFLEFRRVDSIPRIVARTVGNVGNQAQRVALGVTQNAVHGLNHNLDEVDVFPLIEAANVVGFSHFALVENKVNCAGVVFDIEPIAHILALAIDGQGFALADIVDKERYELLGGLVRAVVVRAVGNDCGQSIGVVVGTHEVVARRLARTIWTMGRIGCMLGK